MKLLKLPDRSAVKRTIVCEPELNKALEVYALLYRETYGETESVETLVPFILSTFLAKDRAFAAFRKMGVTQASVDHGNHSGARRRPRGKHSAEAPG